MFLIIGSAQRILLFCWHVADIWDGAEVRAPCRPVKFRTKAAMIQKYEQTPGFVPRAPENHFTST